MGDVSGAGYSPLPWGGDGGYQLRRIYYPPEQRNWGGGNQVAYALKTIMALIHMSAITKSNLNIKLKLLKHFL